MLRHNQDIHLDDKSWQVTFSDMLTLLLTFFVFIISVSSFEVIQYKKFWKEEAKAAKIPDIKARSRSLKFELIKGIKLPRLSPEADEMLMEVESTFENSSYDGVDVYYDENKITLMVSEQLSFDGGMDKLKEEVKPVLIKLIPSINKSKFDINIEGHSDASTSTKVDNMSLSLNRALSVARFMIANGVDAKKISVSGYGPHRPIASNETLEGRMINRRVEVNVLIRND